MCYFVPIASVACVTAGATVAAGCFAGGAHPCPQRAQLGGGLRGAPPPSTARMGRQPAPARGGASCESACLCACVLCIACRCACVLVCFLCFYNAFAVSGHRCDRAIWARRSTGPPAATANSASSRAASGAHSTHAATATRAPSGAPDAEGAYAVTGAQRESPGGASYAFAGPCDAHPDPGCR